MRVFLDANIFISYLLGASEQSVIAQIVEAAVRGEYALLVTRSLLEEMVGAVRRKSYLAQRISENEMRQFCSLILRIAEQIPEIDQPIPSVVRDPKDDYLLAHALMGDADYLVTGDEDLLVLRRVGKLQLVNANDFLNALARHKPRS